MTFAYFRWSVSFKQTNSEDTGDSPPVDIINNYFSIGVVCVSHDMMMLEKFRIAQTANVRFAFMFLEKMSSRGGE